MKLLLLLSAHPLKTRVPSSAREHCVYQETHVEHESGSKLTVCY